MTTLVSGIDHLVLTVADIERTVRFYERALELAHVEFRGPEGQIRHALVLGEQKINLQDRGTETPTKAACPTLGAADFCLIAAAPLDDVVRHLDAAGIPLFAGPVARQGARGALRSIYLRDPDGNLVEIGEYV